MTVTESLQLPKQGEFRGGLVSCFCLHVAECLLRSLFAQCEFPVTLAS